MKVLIALDSSNFAQEILKQVADRTWSKDVEFHLIAAVETFPDWEAEQAFVHQAQVILNDRLAYLQKRLPGIQMNAQAVAGEAANVINDYAQDWGTELIIIGSHGSTGLRKSGIGSVAAKVVNNAPCSVEVVKINNRTNAESSANIEQSAVK
jgi:nucleotide-binding universal stress UspA family protein